jgi:hypothetical protein
MLDRFNNDAERSQWLGTVDMRLRQGLGIDEALLDADKLIVELRKRETKTGDFIL